MTGGDDLVAVTRAALREGDRSALHLLLHPYLHWTDEQGRTTRGRTKVLALREDAGDPGPPADVELRDGQIYRWRCGSG